MPKKPDKSLEQNDDSNESDNEATDIDKNDVEEEGEDNSDDEGEYTYEDEGEEEGDEGEEEEEEDEGLDEIAEEDDEDDDLEEDEEDIIIAEEEEDVESNSIRAPDDERITPKLMTKYEMIRVLGIRTKQLVEGAKPLVSESNGKLPIHVAIDELVAKKMPFKIKRQMPYKVYEIWKIKELTINITQDEIDDLINAIK